MPFKSLTLLPTDGTSGQGAGGYSDGQGSYTMLAVVPGAIKDFKGCPPGRYRVVVSEPLIPMTDADFENGAAGTADGSEPAVAVFLPDSAPRKNVKGGIPNIYTSDKTSPLIIDVAEGNEQIDIELDSTAK